MDDTVNARSGSGVMGGVVASYRVDMWGMIILQLRLSIRVQFVKLVSTHEACTCEYACGLYMWPEYALGLWSE